MIDRPVERLELLTAAIIVCIIGIVLYMVFLARF